MRTRRIILAAVSGTIFLFLYLPLAVVIAHSFNSARYGSGWEGFTLGWYAAVFRNSSTLNALWNTLILALASTCVSTLLGSMLGYGLARHHFPGRAWLDRLLRLPICIPDIVLAVALLLFFGMLSSKISILRLGLGTMILAHVTFQIPFVALAVKARLAGFDSSLEEAACDLGASRWQRFWHVTLPLMRPGIMAGSLLAFTLSLDDFVVSFFTAGAGSTTLPILIYSSVKRGITPEIHALSTLIIAASTLATIAFMLLRSDPKAKNPPLPDANF